MITIKNFDFLHETILRSAFFFEIAGWLGLAIVSLGKNIYIFKHDGNINQYLPAIRNGRGGFPESICQQRMIPYRAHVRHPSSIQVTSAVFGQTL